MHLLNKSKNLTPQPPSLQGKGEPEILLPSPTRRGVGGEVKTINLAPLSLQERGWGRGQNHQQ
ncbi:MAG TPA: hypothetical protein DEG47_30465 [Cyanobacteria bacterium UBA11148]|nr:hypothetical protein [Cyanobacteria bacterium UBA11148]